MVLTRSINWHEIRSMIIFGDITPMMKQKISIIYQRIGLASFPIWPLKGGEMSRFEFPVLALDVQAERGFPLQMGFFLRIQHARCSFSRCTWYFITLYMRVLKLPMIKNIASIYLIIFIIFNAFFNLQTSLF